MFDCIVIGAGAAGIACATALRNAGASVQVLESMPRVGGRAFTEMVGGIPVDWGCHWLHSASRNPLTREAKRLGLGFRRVASARRIHLGGTWRDELTNPGYRRYHDTQVAAIVAAAERDADVPVADLLADEAPYRGWFEFWMTVESSVDAHSVSAVDYARYVDTGENWPVADGLGALIVRLADGLPVATDTHVERIAWGTNRVHVAGAFGTIEARTAVVTASTSALASDRIRFEPALPDWKREAFEGVPLGAASKVVFRINASGRGLDRLFPPVHLLDGSHLPASFGVHVRPDGHAVVIAHTGGAYCAELERAGAAETVAEARATVTRLLGGTAAAHLDAGRTFAWSQVPTVGGAYSCALPGRAALGARLAEPVAQRLYFAGEACSPDFYSTAHGAWLSGLATAERVLEKLKAP